MVSNKVTCLKIAVQFIGTNIKTSESIYSYTCTDMPVVIIQLSTISTIIDKVPSPIETKSEAPLNFGAGELPDHESGEHGCASKPIIIPVILCKDTIPSDNGIIGEVSDLLTLLWFLHTLVFGVRMKERMIYYIVHHIVMRSGFNAEWNSTMMLHER